MQIRLVHLTLGAVAVLSLLALGTVAAAPQASGSPGVGLSPFQRAKAEALLRDRLPCLGCHELDGQGGRIGPSLSDVRSRRDGAYIARMIADPQHTVPGSVMPRVPMPRESAALIATYLGGPEARIAAPLGSLPSSAAASAPDGVALYGKWCAACHGAEGDGNGPNARYLPARPTAHADSASMSARSDDALYDAVFAGGYIMNRSNRMPAFGETLAPDQILALVAHIRRLCRCAGPAWSRDGGGAPAE